MPDHAVGEAAGIALRPTPDPLTAPVATRSGASPAKQVQTGKANDSVLPWTLISRSEDDREIVIKYVDAKPCEEPVGVLVQESSSQVLLAPLSRAVKICSAIGLIDALRYVRLEQPLGRRQLLHG